MFAKVLGELTAAARSSFARLTATAPAPSAPDPAPSPAPTLAQQRAGSEPGWIRVLASEALLSNDAQTISQIYIQSQQSDAMFQRDLLPAIHRYASFVQLLPASESHHHAHVGGLLAHTLEVIVAALKLRNGQLLPRNATAEDIAKERAAWSYAVFFGALLHDIGKVLTDLRIEGRDAQRTTHRWMPMAGGMSSAGFTEYRVGFTPRAQRDYAAHKRLAVALLLAMVPPTALAFLGREPKVYEELVAFLSAEEAAEKGAIAQIVRRADQFSTAQNLANGSRERFASAHAVPLVERMMEAMRRLLAQGTRLPLNRDGAAGWVFDGAIWFVAKRVADEVRAELLRADPEDPGVPGVTKNDRLFDTWQDYRVIELNPETKQAIWYVRLEGEGYCHNFSMLKFPLARIWSDPAGYPVPMDGRIVPVSRDQAKAETVADEGDPKETFEADAPAGVAASIAVPEAAPLPPAPGALAAEAHEALLEVGEAAPAMPMPPPAVPSAPPPSSRRPSAVPPPRAPNAARNKAPSPNNAYTSPKTQSVPAATPAPVKGKPSGGILRESSPEPEYGAARTPASAPAQAAKAPQAAPKQSKEPASESELLDESDTAVAAPTPARKTRRPNGMASGPVQAFSTPPKMATDAEPDPAAIAFMSWLQQGIADGAIKYNEAGAPVHFVQEGMALVTPRIFRDFTTQCCEEAAEAMTVQRLVIRARWNVIGPENSNILNYAVVGRGGQRVGKLAAVVIQHPERWVNPVPPANLAIVPYVQTSASV